MSRDDLIRSIIDSMNSLREFRESEREWAYNAALSHPEFKALEDERRELIKEIASDTFNGLIADEKQANYDKIVCKLKELSARMDIDPFHIQYDCPVCKDTGHTNGKICACVKQTLFEKLRKLSGIDNKLFYTFEMHSEALFKGTSQEKRINNLYTFLKKYSADFPDVKHLNITLSGGTGTGKTFALTALANAVIEKGFMTCYLTAFDMHNAFMKYHISPLDEKSLYLDNLLNADLLVIDDLGTEPVFKNVTLEYLYLLITERTKRVLATCISTNLQPDGIIDRYGQRIFSRLMDKSNSLLIDMNGDDLRLLKR